MKKKIGGYKRKNVKNHPKADTKGSVYVHILVAEEILGRFLTSEETVHHIDYNRSNNDPNNLMVFKTHSDHIIFHGGGESILQEDGTYIAISKENKCNICGDTCSSGAKLCMSCYLKIKAKNIPSKVLLESLVYEKPCSIIAKDYGVSDKAVEKWCKKYNISKPPRGYWMKNKYSGVA